MDKKEQDRINTMRQEEFQLWSRGISSVAGIDEAGRGCLAGPVVSAAVIVRKDIIIEGVNDSKKLTPKKRERLYDKIKENSVAFGIGMAFPNEIDTINIYQATLKSMQRAVDCITPKPIFLLIDGMILKQSIPCKKIVNGDALCYSIATASIIAKVTRDRLMCELDKIYPKYGFARHKGYGTKEHFSALKLHRPCKIHRKSFHPVSTYF